jgi:hypothetical protein
LALVIRGTSAPNAAFTAPDVEAAGTRHARVFREQSRQRKEHLEEAIELLVRCRYGRFLILLYLILLHLNLSALLIHALQLLNHLLGD